MPNGRIKTKTEWIGYRAPEDPDNESLMFMARNTYVNGIRPLAWCLTDDWRQKATDWNRLTVGGRVKACRSRLLAVQLKMKYVKLRGSGETWDDTISLLNMHLHPVTATGEVAAVPESGHQGRAHAYKFSLIRLPNTS